MRVKSAVRRQGIIDAAMEVFGEHGFEQASMSEISARVGGSKKTLYSYFESKEELFLVVMHQLAKMQMQSADMVMDPQKEMSASLQHFGVRLLTMVQSPRMLSAMRMAYARAGHSQASRNFYEQGIRETTHDLTQYFAGCQQLGKLHVYDPTLMAQYFLGMLRAETMDTLLLGVELDAPQPSPAEVAERTVSIFLRAFAVATAS